MIKNISLYFIVFSLLAGLGLMIEIIISQKNSEIYKDMNFNVLDKKVVREPAVAGSFYPANPQELQNLINDFLRGAQAEVVDPPQIIIVPHAGYVFSGATAAYGFKILEKRVYKNVIILGSSHNYPLAGLALYGGDAVKTPLGEVAVNQQILAELIDDNKNININNEAHLPEHSLEVELPFLQTVLPAGWRVILGLINEDDPDMQQSVAQSLKKIMENHPDTLLVISSDLSHYPNYEDALYSDHAILQAIASARADEFARVEEKIMSEGRAALVTCACGATAIKVGLYLASALGLKGEILNYANSGDIKEYGDKNKVVGYGAVAFFKKQKTINSQQLTDNKQQNINSRELLVVSRMLSPEEQKVAVRLARNAIELTLGIAKQQETGYQQYQIFQEKRGVFVTVKSDGDLRGCIGLIEPVMRLAQGLLEMANAAAFEDLRFSPVTAEEIKDITVEISVLTQPQKINNTGQIELGKHGVIVRQAGKSGVFLPQVAEETGWSLEEFMNHLCVDKAGLAAECWRDGSVDIYTFEAQVFGE